MQHPTIRLPDESERLLIRPFQIYSFRYWEIVATIMQICGATKEEAEILIQRQDCCKRTK